MTTTTNGAASAAPTERGDYARVELETFIQTDEGYTFRVVFRDTPIADAVAALTRKGCTPAAHPALQKDEGGRMKDERESGHPSSVRLHPSKGRIDPVYNAQGEPCCPTHQRALKLGQWGMYCTAKDQATGEYCKLKFNQ